MKTHLTTLALIFALLAPLQAEWNIEKPNKEVPKELSGQIWGRKFELGKADWSKATLTISSKNKMEGWPEGELIIFAGNDEEQTEWLITPAKSDFKDPHIHMKFGKKGAKFPGTMMFTGEYCLYLKLVKKKDKKAVFKIHASMPDYHKSYLIGTFEADVR